MADPTVTVFHPAIWAVVVVVIVPLIAALGALLVYQIRQLDSRVINLCRQVARLEGLLGVDLYRAGLHDVEQAPAPCPPPDDDGSPPPPRR